MGYSEKNSFRNNCLFSSTKLPESKRSEIVRHSERSPDRDRSSLVHFRTSLTNNRRNVLRFCETQKSVQVLFGTLTQSRELERVLYFIKAKRVHQRNCLLLTSLLRLSINKFWLCLSSVLGQWVLLVMSVFPLAAIVVNVIAGWCLTYKMTCNNYLPSFSFKFLAGLTTLHCLWHRGILKDVRKKRWIKR